MTATRPDRTPVTIITGFLGSGKTTLLNHLLRSPALAHTAVIVNEFGEIALDHLLVATPAENVVLLESGCICCTVRGELVDTLADLNARREAGALPRFDRVLIETTGLADPVPILQTLITDAAMAALYRLDGVVSLVDAVHGESQLDSHPEALKQAALADRLLVTKVDLVAPGARASLEARLERVNPGAEPEPVANGVIDPGRVFGAAVADAVESGLARWLNVERYRTGEGRRPAGYRRGHVADSGISSFCIELEKPVTAAGLVLWLNLLAALRGANLLRVKGLLNVEGRPVVVHAVQTLIHDPVTLERWPDAERRSRLVFITRGMKRSEIEKTLAALEYTGPRAADSPALDPEAYARFVAVAKNFR